MVRLGSKNKFNNLNQEEIESENKIIFSLAKCDGSCVYSCQFVNGEWVNPILNTSNCSSGCACPPLTSEQQNCVAGTTFSNACV